MKLTNKKKAELFDQLNRMILNDEVRILFHAGPNASGKNLDRKIFGCTSYVASAFKCSNTGYASLLTDPMGTIDFAMKESKKEQNYAQKTMYLIKEKNPTKNKVYLMLNRRNGYVKIGRTIHNPELRERTLQSEDPDIELILSIECDKEAEPFLHDLFKEKRLRGEWFNLSMSDIELAVSFMNFFGVN